MNSYTNVLVRFDNHIGSFIASESKIIDNRLLECNGKKINRSDYKELFEYYNFISDNVSLPDFSGILPNQIYFYLIAK